MGENPKIGLTQMNKNGNLQYRIRVQVGQVQVVEIKEAVEVGRNKKRKAADKKRTIDDRLMGVLRRNSDPAANLPRAEFF
jgi:IS4 transposase